MTPDKTPTEAELLPCPFCGEAAKHSFNSLYGDMSMASCKSCGATAYAPKWNRRAVLAKWGSPVGAEWRDVVGFEGLYQVSNHGDIRNNKSGLLLAKSLMGAGYVKADLYKDGKRTQTSAHRVVAQAFVDNPDWKPQVNHINGVKDDNRASNLEWCDKTTDHLHRYYELGKVAASIEATNTATGETIFYPSITQAARDGFESSHIYRCLSGDIKQSNGWSFKRPTTDSFTTPQPTQAQAGAVPLIDEQIRAMLNKHPPEDVCGWSYRMGIEDAELHHGIKGGQQAAD